MIFEVAEERLVKSRELPTPSPSEVRSWLAREDEGKRQRYWLRDQVLRIVTNTETCSRCGLPRDGSIQLIRSMPDGGIPSVAVKGLGACASVWKCPVCAARIRKRRGDEVAAGLAVALAKGWVAIAGLVSVPHIEGENLKAVWDRLGSAWSYLASSGGWWRRFRERYGIEGFIWGDDVTYGLQGWHPHRHVILIVSKPIGKQDVVKITEEVSKRLRVWAHGLGLPVPVSVANGWQMIRTPKAAALYVAGATVEKVSGMRRTELAGYAAEVTRLDRKVGKVGRTPFELLADGYRACLASGGDVTCFSLWEEFELACRRRPSVRWSAGLKATLKVDEITDEEAVREVEVTGCAIETMEVAAHEWREHVYAVPGREASVRLAFRDGGVAAVSLLLSGYASALTSAAPLLRSSSVSRLGGSSPPT